MTWLAFIGAAITEIAGCFSFWAWIKLNKSILWLIPGALSLCLFAYLLTRAETEYAGRAYAAYGAIYIVSSIMWMWVVEKNPPDRFDVIGVMMCLFGAGIILYSSKLFK
jgi:small multidrug resistance family-3 protein